MQLVSCGSRDEMLSVVGAQELILGALLRIVVLEDYSRISKTSSNGRRGVGARRSSIGGAIPARITTCG